MSGPRETQLESRASSASKPKSSSTLIWGNEEEHLWAWGTGRCPAASPAANCCALDRPRVPSLLCHHPSSLTPTFLLSLSSEPPSPSFPLPPPLVLPVQAPAHLHRGQFRGQCCSWAHSAPIPLCSPPLSPAGPFSRGWAAASFRGYGSPSGRGQPLLLCRLILSIARGGGICALTALVLERKEADEGHVLGSQSPTPGRSSAYLQHDGELAGPVVISIGV